MEKLVIAGVKASVTVFRQDGPYELEGRTLVTVIMYLHAPSDDAANTGEVEATGQEKL